MIYIRLTLSRFYLFLQIIFVFALLNACDSIRPLNSERIAHRYGNYGIEILSASEHRRISSLYSERDGQRTMRTLALVEFNSASVREIASEHQRILAGGSIGAVFKEAGWTIDKLLSHYCLSQSDLKSLPDLRRMQLSLPAVLATHVYVFHVQKDAISIDYATITEIHHPDFLQAADLDSGNLDDC